MTIDSTGRFPLRCGEQLGECELHIHERSDGERMLRAAMLGLLGLGMTAVSALIPIVHFIAVPVFLLVTLLMSGLAFGTKRVITHGAGKCPACGGTVTIHKRSYRLPFSDVCDSCHRAVTISARTG